VAAVAATRSDLATDKVKPLDELLEVGCRNNPGWVAEDLEPRPESTRPSTPAVPNWLYASYDIDRWRDTMARSPVPPCITGDPGVAPNVTVRAEGRSRPASCVPADHRAYPGRRYSIHPHQFRAYLTAVKTFSDEGSWASK
jgi:hypothetical protein